MRENDLKERKNKPRLESPKSIAGVGDGFGLKTKKSSSPFHSPLCNALLFVFQISRKLLRFLSLVKRRVDEPNKL